MRFAAAHAGVDGTFVVVNGDVLTDMDLSALVAFHRSHGAEGTIALHPVDDPSAYGVVPTDGSGRVTAFVEKPPRELGHLWLLLEVGKIMAAGTGKEDHGGQGGGEQAFHLKGSRTIPRGGCCNCE